MGETAPEPRNPADDEHSSDRPKQTPKLVRSLLDLLAQEPGSGLVEIHPGVYIISKDFTVEQLNQD